MFYSLQWIQTTWDALPMRPTPGMRVRLSSSLVAAVLIGGGCSSNFVETATNHYSNYGEAAEDGALQRGWLPRNLPGSAHNIVETHNIDTNELWAKFQLDQADIDRFLRHCAKSADIRLPPAERTEKMAAWWPDALTDKSVERLPNGMQTYHCSKIPHAKSELDAGMILDAEEQAIWYWVDPNESKLSR